MTNRYIKCPQCGAEAIMQDVDSMEPGLTFRGFCEACKGVIQLTWCAVEDIDYDVLEMLVDEGMPKEMLKLHADHKDGGKK